jgi:hypothetical protein
MFHLRFLQPLIDIKSRRFTGRQSKNTRKRRGAEIFSNLRAVRNTFSIKSSDLHHVILQQDGVREAGGTHDEKLIIQNAQAVVIDLKFRLCDAVVDLGGCDAAERTVSTYSAGTVRIPSFWI